MRNLREVAQDWDQAAQEDPFFNILTIPGLSREDFWASGVQEIDELLEGLDVERDRALDFGCGVGRLTQALARHFKRVAGVDVSAEMVRLAEGFNRYSWVRYHRNQRKTLRWANDSFDLVYSNIVLQHMPTPLAYGYVREFLRVSRGYAVFQIPEGPMRENGALSMYGTPRAEVEGWLGDTEIVNVEANDASGAGFKSYRYITRVK